MRALKESDAYPAMSERGYGWEKLISEMFCQEYWAERGLETQIARFAEKVSIDYAVMEPASDDPAISVLAVPLAVDWLDIGSWPAFGLSRSRDEAGNAIAAPRCVLQDSSRLLVVSDVPGHLLAVDGCEDLIVVHTRDATLICRSDQAESIKRLHATVAARFGGEYI